jgi:hypothetical protein
MDFYAANGFERGEVINDYYKKIDPPHCYVLRKMISPSEEEVGSLEDSNSTAIN